MLRSLISSLAQMRDTSLPVSCCCCKGLVLSVEAADTSLCDALGSSISLVPYSDGDDSFCAWRRNTLNKIIKL